MLRAAAACASWAIQSGASVKRGQKMLGHESAALILDVYADLFDQDLDDIASRMSRPMSTKGAQSSVAVL